jgi:hypothetical protein
LKPRGANEFGAAEDKNSALPGGQPEGWLVLTLHSAEVPFYCGDRAAAHSDKSAKP